MWEVEYTKRFLKELSKLPKEVQVKAEKIVFEELLSANPLNLGYTPQKSIRRCPLR